MEELIRKSDTLETYAELYDIFDDNKAIQEELHKVYDKLNDIPAVEPKKGKWIGARIRHYPGYECSLCHYGVQPWNNTNYCPNCGARMKGVDDANR